MKFLNVCGWLTHGDADLDTDCDFLLLIEISLIPARTQNECVKLRRNKIASVWSPAFQDTSHVGAGWIGLVSWKGPSLSALHCNTEFSRIGHMGRALRESLPTGSGRVAPIWGACGFQGAGKGREKLALTELLFHAVVREAKVRGKGQGLSDCRRLQRCALQVLSRWVDLEAAWPAAHKHLQSELPCFPWVDLDRWFQFLFSANAMLDVGRWDA